MTAIRIGAVWSAPTWVRKAAMPARAGGLQDQHHHDHRAGEQSTVGAGEADQGVHLGVLVTERPSPGEPGASPATHGAQRLLRAQAGPPDQRHRRDRGDPRNQPRVDMLAFQVGEQARYLLGQTHQTTQQPNPDTGRRGDRHPPPLPAEPTRIGIGVPLAAEVNHTHEYQTRECAEDPESDRVAHQGPELPLLGDRHLRSRLGRSTHHTDLLTARFARSAAAAGNSPQQQLHRLDYLPDASTNRTSHVASSGTRVRRDHDRAAAFQATGHKLRSTRSQSGTPELGVAPGGRPVCLISSICPRRWPKPGSGCPGRSATAPPWRPWPTGPWA
jgi:hypothetical protein